MAHILEVPFVNVVTRPQQTSVLYDNYTALPQPLRSRPAIDVMGYKRIGDLQRAP